MNGDEKLLRELDSFDKVWRGGYYEGDPLDPLAPSSYGVFGYISVLHAVYVYCIRPYVTENTTVLEIGPGRGAWTKTMLHAKEIWCLDAKSRKDNDIDYCLGDPNNLVYHQVRDFSCRELPDDKFDFLFSFGALVHVSWDGIVQYAYNLYPKLRSGANAFAMVADYEKANKLVLKPWRYDVITRVLSAKRMRILRILDHILRQKLGRHSFISKTLGIKWQVGTDRVLGYRLTGRPRVSFKDKNEDSEPRPSRWFHAGIDRTATLLEEVGYIVVDKDIGLVNRDPIIHFRKP